MGLVIREMWELCDCNIACGSCLSYVGQSSSGRCASRCGSEAAFYFTVNQVRVFSSSHIKSFLDVCSSMGDRKHEFRLHKDCIFVK